MKPTGFPLLVLVLAGTLAAQTPAAITAAAPVAKPLDAPSEALAKEGIARTSSRLTQEIQATLPKYDPPPKVLDQPKDVGSDPDVLALPKFTVKEYRPRDHDPDVWLTQRAVQQKAMAAYKQSLTDFEWALNGWYIPLFGSSPSARARGAYAANKALAETQRVHRLFSIISLADPKAAADLEQERVKMEQTEYWQGRPAGHGRSK